MDVCAFPESGHARLNVQEALIGDPIPAISRVASTSNSRAKVHFQTVNSPYDRF